MGQLLCAKCLRAFSRAWNNTIQFLAESAQLKGLHISGKLIYKSYELHVLGEVINSLAITTIIEETEQTLSSGPESITEPQITQGNAGRDEANV
jgi:hypothetical protein